MAVIELEDNGTGISESDLTCIFEPFFITKPQGQGTGLGLDTVWRIVTEEQAGNVTVHPNQVVPFSGYRFRSRDPIRESRPDLTTRRYGRSAEDHDR